MSGASAFEMTEWKERYTSLKIKKVSYTLRKAQVRPFLDRMVTVTIDRSLGSAHPKHDDMIYSINY